MCLIGLLSFSPFSNGIGRSGVFVALHIIIDRMQAEGVVDVFQTVKNLRIQRPATVQTLVRRTNSYVCWPKIKEQFILCFGMVSS